MKTFNRRKLMGTGIFFLSIGVVVLGITAPVFARFIQNRSSLVFNGILSAKTATTLTVVTTGTDPVVIEVSGRTTYAAGQSLASLLPGDAVTITARLSPPDRPFGVLVRKLNTGSYGSEGNNVDVLGNVVSKGAASMVIDTGVTKARFVILASTKFTQTTFATLLPGDAVQVIGTEAASNFVAREVIKRRIQGRVLGASTFRPILTVLSLPNRSYRIPGGKSITPFDRLYFGSVWGEKVDFGETLGVLYLFGNRDPFSRGAVKAYDQNGKLLRAYSLWNRYSSNGTNPTFTVNTDDNVLMTVASTMPSDYVRTYSVNPKGIASIHPIKVTGKPALLKAKFSNAFGLLTFLKGQHSPLKVFTLDTLRERFLENLTVNKADIKQ